MRTCHREHSLRRESGGIILEVMMRARELEAAAKYNRRAGSMALGPSDRAWHPDRSKIALIGHSRNLPTVRVWGL
jgi:hypothetical protein